ncbi:MAG: imidazoleglycerol-phosphate dehydratase HisB [Actinomycetota bacterium]|nr:imidazoleglycerol-phosphate dehydratase HisB [Actinomycetota bacterium]
MRKASLKRKTRETDIALEINLDGKGNNDIKTSVPFFDHMLTLMSRHGLMDLKIKAKGDVDVDYHHTVEDVGIALGKAIKEALGDMKGIRRYGAAAVPMDEALAHAYLDISGRPYLVYNLALPKKAKIKDFDADLAQDFFQALAGNAGMTLHIQVPYGRNVHHMIEAVFKAVGRAIMEAVSLDPRQAGRVPSTKGKI